MHTSHTVELYLHEITFHWLTSEEEPSKQTTNVRDIETFGLGHKRVGLRNTVPLFFCDYSLPMKVVHVGTMNNFLSHFVMYDTNVWPS